MSATAPVQQFIFPLYLDEKVFQAKKGLEIRYCTSWARALISSPEYKTAKMNFPLNPFEKEVATANCCQIWSQVECSEERVPVGVCPAGLHILVSLRHKELYQPNLRHAQAEMQKSLVSRNLQGQNAGAD